MKIRFLGDLAELNDGIAVIAEMLGVEIADGEYVFEVTHTDENKLSVTLDGKRELSFTMRDAHSSAHSVLP